MIFHIPLRVVRLPADADVEEIVAAVDCVAPPSLGVSWRSGVDVTSARAVLTAAREVAWVAVVPDRRRAR